MPADTANPDTIYFDAHYLREARDFRAALKRYGDFLAAVPAGSTHKAVLKALIGSIHCAEALGDAEAMERVSRRLVETFPDNVLGALSLGESLISLGRHAEGFAALTRSLQLDQSNLADG